MRMHISVFVNIHSYIYESTEFYASGPMSISSVQGSLTAEPLFPVLCSLTHTPSAQTSMLLSQTVCEVIKEHLPNHL